MRRIASGPLSRDVLVPLPAGGAVPLGEVAKVQQTRGPNTIRTENSQLAVYIYVDMQGCDIGSYVARRKCPRAPRAATGKAAHGAWSYSCVFCGVL